MKMKQENHDEISKNKDIPNYNSDKYKDLYKLNKVKEP